MARTPRRRVRKRSTSRFAGSATLIAGDEAYDLVPGTMGRVAPAQRRRLLPGPDGFQYVAIGGRVGTHTPSPGTELGGPWPMPPIGLRFEGSAAVGEFFATQPLEGRLDRITHTVTRANGQPTLASYADHEAYGVMVFALRADRIAGITGFPHDLDVFTQLGLPARSTT